MDDVNLRPTGAVVVEQPKEGVECIDLSPSVAEPTNQTAEIWRGGNGCWWPPSGGFGANGPFGRIFSNGVGKLFGSGKSVCGYLFKGLAQSVVHMFGHRSPKGASRWDGGSHVPGKHGMHAVEFQILATTERIPHDSYCVAKAVPKALADQIQEALLALRPGSEAAVKVLSGARIQGFAPIKEAAYDLVKQYLDAELKAQPAK